MDSGNLRYKMQTNDDQEESHLRKIWNLWAPEGFMDEKEWPRLSLYPWAQQLKFSAKIVCRKSFAQFRNKRKFESSKKSGLS